MRSFLWWFGVIVGALALAGLVVHGFGLSLASPLAFIVDRYDLVTQTIFAPLAPATNSFGALRYRNGHELQLLAQWKDVFLILWLYFTADIRSAVEQRHWTAALVLLLWGSVVAYAVGIAVAIAPILSDSAASAKVALVAFPAVGVTLHQAGWCLIEAALMRRPGEPIVSRFVMFLRAEVVPIAVGAFLVVVAAGYAQANPPLSSLPQPATAVLLAMFAALALFHLRRGAVYAAPDRTAGESWWRALNRTGSARLAVFILSTLAGTGVLLAIDELLKSASH
jgi:hypothetical protein